MLNISEEGKMVDMVKLKNHQFSGRNKLFRKIRNTFQPNLTFPNKLSFNVLLFGAIQKIRVNFLDYFGGGLPPCVNLCHFSIPPLNKYVLKYMTPPPHKQKYKKLFPFKQQLNLVCFAKPFFLNLYTEGK